MKSITIPMVLMILLTSFYLSAQTKIGFTAGGSFATVAIKAGGISVSPKLKPGITAGFFIDASLGSNFSFHPGLNFVQKGYLIKDGSSKDKVNFNYIELPLNFVYNTNKNKGFFIGAGPSVAFGISGREKYTDKDFPEDNYDEKIKFGSGSDEIKSIDFGVNALAGYKFAHGFMVSANYTLGLGNIANDSNDNPDGNATIKNRYFAVKIGYIFSGNKRK